MTQRSFVTSTLYEWQSGVRSCCVDFAPMQHLRNGTPKRSGLPVSDRWFRTAAAAAAARKDNACAMECRHQERRTITQCSFATSAYLRQCDFFEMVLERPWLLFSDRWFRTAAKATAASKDNGVCSGMPTPVTNDSTTQLRHFRVRYPWQSGVRSCCIDFAPMRRLKSDTRKTTAIAT